MILGYLYQEEQTALTKSSRALHEIVKPLLYRYIGFDWRPLPLERLLQLTRTIHGRPELTHQVKGFKVAVHDSSFYPSETESFHMNLHYSYSDVIVEDLDLPHYRWQGEKDGLRYANSVEHAINIVKAAKFPNEKTWMSFYGMGTHMRTPR